jgi:glycosyltransferase involved in cell wall biosynthesis
MTSIADTPAASSRLIQSESKPSVCIVCHKAYGAVRGGVSGHIGGVEWQAGLLAKSLAQLKYEVTVLTWDEGGPAVEMINGVRVIKIARQSAGIRGLRFFHPKWTGLVKALRQADCDVYYHHGAECVTGQVALWCERNGKAFVFYAANDTDCQANLPEFRTPWDRALYRYGLRHATVRLTQTETQKATLKKDFGLESIVLRYPCEDPQRPGLPLSAPVSNRVLWIARVCRQKRPDRLLDVAEGCPELEFDLVGPLYSDEWAQTVAQRARGMRNVTLHGPITRDQVTVFYQKAACLCCTSDYEGFPNTFLEAWSNGLPIVSTFDPESLIEKKRLGIVAKSVSELQTALRSLMKPGGDYRGFSENAYNYFRENHILEAVIPKYELVLRNAMESCPSRRA